MKIYTLGTASRQHYEFTKILSKYGIQIVLDLRVTTLSSNAPQFNRDSLQMLCASQRSEYVYLGNEVGRNLTVEFRPAQEGRLTPLERSRLRDWQASDEFRRAVDIISEKAKTRVTCVLCTERAPSDCHRLYLADALAKKGLEIVHILDESSLWNRPRALNTGGFQHGIRDGRRTHRRRLGDSAPGDNQRRASRTRRRH